MRRRTFITLIGGAVVSWPLAVRAQQADRIPLIGVAMSLSSDDPESQVRLTAFLQTLQELGWNRSSHARSRQPDGTEAQ